MLVGNFGITIVFFGTLHGLYSLCAAIIGWYVLHLVFLVYFEVGMGFTPSHVQVQ